MFVFHTEKLKVTTHCLSWLLHSKQLRYLSCFRDLWHRLCPQWL